MKSYSCLFALVCLSCIKQNWKPSNSRILRRRKDKVKSNRKIMIDRMSYIVVIYQIDDDVIARIIFSLLFFSRLTQWLDTLSHMNQPQRKGSTLTREGFSLLRPDEPVILKNIKYEVKRLLISCVHSRFSIVVIKKNNA